MVIKVLYSELVPRREKRLVAFVPNDEDKIPEKTRRTISPPLFIGRENDLTVGNFIQLPSPEG